MTNEQRREIALLAAKLSDAQQVLEMQMSRNVYGMTPEERQDAKVDLELARADYCSIRNRLDAIYATV